MPAWWGKKSTKNKEFQQEEKNHTSKASIKNRGRDDKKTKSFDDVFSRNSPRSSKDFLSFSTPVGAGGGNNNIYGSGGSSSGFSGFGSDRGHPLPQPSNLSPTASFGGVVVDPAGLGSASASVSSGSSSVSSDDPSNSNLMIDHGQLGFYRGHALSPQPRSPGPGSRMGTAATSPLHPRFNGPSLDSPNKECHPLPLPPGSPTSSSNLQNPRSSGLTDPLPLHRSADSLPLPPHPGSPTSSSNLQSSRSSGWTENLHGQLSKWKKGKLLGRGTFGHVYLGFNSESGQMCAIKEVRVGADDQSSKECLKQLNQEINLLNLLSHQNIVQYYGSELGDESLSVYLEYVSGGSIHKLLQEYGAFREPVIQNYTRQILSGLAYLHGRNTVHRDIKGANILVDPNGEIKLADFGMAKHITSCTSMLSFKGSPYWMAPEVVMNTNGYSLAVDIWSLGCTVLEMATSKPPWGQYEGVAAIFKIGNSKDIPEIPDHLSKDAKSFIILCLQRDPSARPSASKLLDHPFVRDQATTRGANVSLTKEAFPSAFDGSRTPTATDLHLNRTNINSWDGDYASKPVATSSRGALISPRNNARTIAASMPVSPSSSPLRQYEPAYKSVYLSPPHPSYAMMGRSGCNMNDQLSFPIRPNSKNTINPWYEIPQFRAQTPPNRSPRTRPI